MNTILIVDDNPDAVVLAQHALSRTGLDIRTESASSGHEALRKLCQTQDLPALILLDLVMVGIDGIETLRRIRSDERLKHIPVVFVTLSAFESDEARAREAGANGFIRKVISMVQFTRELERHVKLHCKPAMVLS